MDSWLPILIIIPCLSMFVEYRFGFLKDKLAYSREEIAMIGIEKTISKNSTSFSRVAVGVNANVDLILSATKLFSKLGMQSYENPQNHDLISSLRELEETFSFYFKKCAAAERFVTSKEVFDTIVTAARLVENAQIFNGEILILPKQKLQKLLNAEAKFNATEIQYDVGGNAAIMGLKMLYSNSNSTVMLGGPIGPKLESLLNGKLVIPDALKQDSDEYHLILEYGVGEKWGDHVSKCGNRFIISHDIANGEMTAMGKFFESLKTFDSEMIVVSGLHLLEGQTDEIKTKKVLELKEHLLLIPSHIPIHLELASMTSQVLMKEIAMNIFPVIDSIGLNEQELGFISTSLGGPGDAVELGQWPPEIGLMSDILHWVLNLYGRNLRYGAASSRLTRIHFHCLTYHIIATVPNTWSNSDVAVAAGSRAASRQACDSENLLPTDVELRTPKDFARSVKFWELRRNLLKRDEANPVTSWKYDNVHFYFSSVLVCKKPKRTVGLGDCISATGLQYSVFLNR